MTRWGGGRGPVPARLKNAEAARGGGGGGGMGQRPGREAGRGGAGQRAGGEAGHGWGALALSWVGSGGYDG